MIKICQCQIQLVVYVGETAAIKLDRVSKKFLLSRIKQDTLKESLLTRTKRTAQKETMWALKDLTLTVKGGECLGLIGKNGSGKTTLLKVIAGILDHNKGNLQINGDVAPLISLGSSFDPELTAKENVKTYCAMMGVGNDELASYLKKITEFAGLGDYISAKTKNLSEGMKMRLAFATSIHLDGDIFLIDEAFAVGDELFKEKCKFKVRDLLEQGKTVIYASHDLGQVERICDKVLLLRNGSKRAYGDPKTVLSQYEELLHQEKEEKKLKALNQQSLGDNLTLAGKKSDLDYLYRQKDELKVSLAAQGSDYCILSLTRTTPALEVDERSKGKQTRKFLTYACQQAFTFKLPASQLSSGYYKLDALLPEEKKTYNGPYIKIEGSKSAQRGKEELKLGTIFCKGNFPLPSDSALYLPPPSDQQRSEQRSDQFKTSLREPTKANTTFSIKEWLDGLTDWDSLLSVKKIKEPELEEIKREDILKEYLERKAEEREINIRSKIIRRADISKNGGQICLSLHLNRAYSKELRLVIKNKNNREPPGNSGQPRRLVVYPHQPSIEIPLSGKAPGIYDLDLYHKDEMLLQAKNVFIPPGTEAKDLPLIMHLGQGKKAIFNGSNPLQALKRGQIFQLITDLRTRHPPLTSYHVLENGNIVKEGTIRALINNPYNFPLIVEDLSFNSALKGDATLKAGGKLSFDLALTYLPCLHSKASSLQALINEGSQFLLSFRQEGEEVLLYFDSLESWRDYFNKLEENGRLSIRCNIPHVPLESGNYTLNLGLKTGGEANWATGGDRFSFRCRTNDNFASQLNTPAQLRLKKGYQLVEELQGGGFSASEASDLPYQVSKELSDCDWSQLPLSGFKQRGPDQRSQWYEQGTRCGYGGVKFERILVSPALAEDEVRLNRKDALRLGLIYKFTEKVKRPVLSLELTSESDTFRVCTSLEGEVPSHREFRVEAIPSASYDVSFGIFYPTGKFPPREKYEDYPYDFIKDAFRLQVV